MLVPVKSEGLFLHGTGTNWSILGRNGCPGNALYQTTKKAEQRRADEIKSVPPNPPAVEIAFAFWLGDLSYFRGEGSSNNNARIILGQTSRGGCCD